MKHYLYIALLGLSIIKLSWSQENIIRNPEFDAGRRSWVIKSYNGASMSFEFPQDSLMSGPASCKIKIENSGNNEDVIMYQSFPLNEGFFYQFSFMATADSAFSIQVRLKESSGLERIFWMQEVDLAPSPTHFGSFKFYNKINANSRLQFMLGGKDNVNVRLDSIWCTAEKDPNFIATVDKFEKRMHAFENTTLPYRLCPPDFYDPLQEYPLVLCLHGAGERGTDNQIQIDPHRMATSWADSLNQKKHPCFVVAPQCPVDNRWVDSNWSLAEYRVSEIPTSNEMLTLIDLLDSLTTEFSVDTNRLYVTGLSMGGYGAWDIITRYPNKFAAAVPMSGGGDSTRVERIKHIPIWAFHGEKDTTVPVKGSRQMITALENQGLESFYTHCQEGDCTGKSVEEIALTIENDGRLLYTELQGKGHVMWAESYDYPYLFPWVFSQNKQKNPEPTKIKLSKKKAIEHFNLKQNYPNPFNSQTTISFELAQKVNVNIEIYNIKGQKIISLLDKERQAGMNRILFDATDLPSGSYIYQITASDFSKSMIMTLQR
jgi:predicted peptidase